MTLALLALLAHAQEADYQLNASASTLYVVVLKDPSTFAAGQAHDHAVGATGWSGTVHWDPANLSACKVHFSVPISGLRVDPAGYRTRAHLDPAEVSDADKATIAANFSGKNQLDARSFPSIQFDSSGCIQSGAKVTVTGNLNMHGKSRPTTVSMSVTADGTAFKASGAFDANHTDWGFDPFSAFFGAVKNLNKLTFVIDVVGAKI